jgi:hypothetical protein
MNPLHLLVSGKQFCVDYNLPIDDYVQALEDALLKPTKQPAKKKLRLMLSPLEGNKYTFSFKKSVLRRTLLNFTGVIEPYDNDTTRVTASATIAIEHYIWVPYFLVLLIFVHDLPFFVIPIIILTIGFLLSYITDCHNADKVFCTLVKDGAPRLLELQ